MDVSTEVIGDPSGASGSLEYRIPRRSWETLRVLQIRDMFPTRADVDLSVLRDFSEACRFDLVLEYYGGARIVDASIYEVPLAHGQDHNTTALQSVHGYSDGYRVPRQPQTPGPQTDARDLPGADERRFGTLQLARVAQRLVASTGPRIFAWTPFSPGRAAAFDAGPPQTSGWTDPNQDYVTLPASTAMREITTSAITAWSEDAPGWLADGVTARTSRINGPTFPQDRGWIPVRVYVYARVSGGAATLVLASSEHDQVHVPIASTSFEWHTALGWLQCQAAGDQDGVANIVALYSTSSGQTLDLGSICVDYSSWA